MSDKIELDNLHLTWGNAVVILIFIIVSGFIVLMIAPSNEIVNYVVHTGITGSPLLIPYDQKTTLAKNITNTTDNIRQNVTDFPKFVTSEAVKYVVPTNIAKDAVKGIPDSYIDPAKCNRIVLNKPLVSKFNKMDKLKIPANLPWDEKIDYCKLREGTLDDVDLNQTTVMDNSPKIILY